MLFALPGFMRSERCHRVPGLRVIVRDGLRIDRTFTITFGDEGPVLTLGDRRFPLDLQAGTVDGVEME